MTNGRLRGGGPGERRISSRQVHPVGLGRRVGRGLGKRGGLHSVGRYEKRDGPDERRGILQCPPADCLPAHPRRPLKCNDVQDWPYQAGVRDGLEAGSADFGLSRTWAANDLGHTRPV